VSVVGLRLVDPSGTEPDVVFDSLTTGLVAKLRTTTAADTLKFDIDPNRCSSCDFSKPSEFIVTFLFSADQVFAPFTEVRTTKSFQILKISRNPDAITTYGVDDTEFDMQDAFHTNFDDVADASYEWL
jgi:hypothetical protein